MTSVDLNVVVAVAVFVPMAVEAARASKNERAQRDRGGIEASDDVYPGMRVVYPVAFLLMIVEGAVRNRAPSSAFVSGAAVFAFAKALKWWAIATLGRAWTFRVIVVRGDPIVARGPYRWLRHPNYAAVLGEFVGAALMTGAEIAGIIGTMAFALLLRKRIAVEERALATARRA